LNASVSGFLASRGMAYHRYLTRGRHADVRF
jgi:hypothetical protein